MFLPISDAPNPKAIPFATWTLIALNVAVFLFVNVPLGAQRADVNDPEFREYVEFLSQQVGRPARPRPRSPSRPAPTTCSSSSTATARPPGTLTDLLFAMFLHGGLHAPVREHAVPVDLRGQRGAPPRARSRSSSGTW